MDTKGWLIRKWDSDRGIWETVAVASNHKDAWFLADAANGILRNAFDTKTRYQVTKED